MIDILILFFIILICYLIIINNHLLNKLNNLFRVNILNNFNVTKPNYIFDYNNEFLDKVTYSKPISKPITTENLKSNSNKDVCENNMNNTHIKSTKFINNLKSWYPNTYIDSININNKSHYKAFNNDISDETIMINTDIENLDFKKITQLNINKPISIIYDNLIGN